MKNELTSEEKWDKLKQKLFNELDYARKEFKKSYDGSFSEGVCWGEIMALETILRRIERMDNNYK